MQRGNNRLRSGRDVGDVVIREVFLAELNVKLRRGETVDGFRDGESGVIVEPQAALTAV